MKRVLIMALAGWLLSATFAIDEVSAKGSVHQILRQKAENGKKEANRYKKEDRKAKREEYKQRKNNKAELDHRRIMRENHKQRKKMEKASRKENRRNWGSNELGDVFNVY